MYRWMTRSIFFQVLWDKIKSLMCNIYVYIKLMIVSNDMIKLSNECVLKNSGEFTSWVIVNRNVDRKNRLVLRDTQLATPEKPDYLILSVIRMYYLILFSMFYIIFLFLWSWYIARVSKELKWFWITIFLDKLKFIIF